jgi:hypothetical protein
MDQQIIAYDLENHRLQSELTQLKEANKEFSQKPPPESGRRHTLVIIIIVIAYFHYRKLDAFERRNQIATTRLPATVGRVGARNGTDEATSATGTTEKGNADAGGRHQQQAGSPQSRATADQQTQPSDDGTVTCWYMPLYTHSRI